MNDATQTLEPFVGQWAVLLTTYKREGTPVGTAVNIAVEGDLAYFRTWDTAWKLRRIRNNLEVEFAPSTARGKPTAPPIRARARVLEGEGSARGKTARQQVSCPARPPCPTGPSPQGQQDDARRANIRGRPVADYLGAIRIVSSSLMTSPAL
jgi:PPOX class probable F420-dependent enzyme